MDRSRYIIVHKLIGSYFCTEDALFIDRHELSNSNLALFIDGDDIDRLELCAKYGRYIDELITEIA